MESCFSCKNETNQQVQCGLCQHLFCQNCCYQYQKLHLTSAQTLLCSGCLALSKKIQHFIHQQDIQWNHLTPRGQKWLQCTKTQQFILKNQGSIQTYSTLPLNQDDLQLIQKDVNTGRSDPQTFIWQYAQTLCRVSTENYRQNISNVLRAYCARNPNIGYCQGLNYVSVWLLLFMDQNSAFWMLCNLVQNWLLPDFYISSKRGNSLNGFYIESTVIAGLLDHLVPSMAALDMPSDQFSDMFSLQLLIQLFISTVDLQSNVYLWDKLTSEGSIALIRGTVSLVSLSQKALRNGTHPLHLSKQITQHRIAPQLAQMYSHLTPEITETRVQRLRTQARNYRAKQWETCQRLVQKRLEKHSQFSAEQIQAMRVQFKRFLKYKRQQKGQNLEVPRRCTVYLPQHINQQIQNTEGEVDIGITRQEFLSFIQPINQHLVDQAGALFDQFDDDKSGYLDFRELMLCLSIISKGTFEQKLKVCFNAYDIDHSGYLVKQEMMALLGSLLRPYATQLTQNFDFDIKSKIQQVNIKIVKLVTQKQSVSFEEFLNTVRSDTLLFSCFSEHVQGEGLGVIELAGLIRRATPQMREDRTGRSQCSGCSLFQIIFYDNWMERRSAVLRRVKMYNKELRKLSPVGASLRQVYSNNKTYQSALNNIKLIQRRFNQERKKIQSLLYNPIKPQFKKTLNSLNKGTNVQPLADVSLQYSVPSQSFRQKSKSSKFLTPLRTRNKQPINQNKKKGEISLVTKSHEVLTTKQQLQGIINNCSEIACQTDLLFKKNPIQKMTNLVNSLHQKFVLTESEREMSPGRNKDLVDQRSIKKMIQENQRVSKVVGIYYPRRKLWRLKADILPRKYKKELDTYMKSLTNIKY